MTEDHPRLIERAFPLKQASLDSVHEKNVRHGHISTLHIWPARRPLAACRAALIAALLPDPGTPEERRKLIERIGGRIAKKPVRRRAGDRVIETVKEETVGGVLHWGRENSPDMDYFREEIKKAFGGRAPRVLDPFAGGGSIPLEAMRLGCEVTAMDINPVAWFILKCTLEYPQKLAGQKRPLPDFILQNKEFMEAFFKANPGYVGSGRPTKKQLELAFDAVATGEATAPLADLAWHVRAWGHWVLERARKELEPYYPVIDGKPTVAYLWARTVRCKNCGATIPLLKTLWLCKKPNKRVKLELKPRPDKSGVDFEIVEPPVVGGNAAQRREHDKQIGRGTMSRSGAWCPVCGEPGSVSMTMTDIRDEGMADRLGRQMLAVVINDAESKQYRLPVDVELAAADISSEELERVFNDLPSGLPMEPIAPASTRSISCDIYGLNRFGKLFMERQLLALGVFAGLTRMLPATLTASGVYDGDWREGILAYMALAVDRLANQATTLCRMDVGRESLQGTFVKFALPMLWDFAEVNPISDTTGAYLSNLNWVCLALSNFMLATRNTATPEVRQDSVTHEQERQCWDIVVTDPPYYEAISYGDLSDFFYVWLRRTVSGTQEHFASPLTDKSEEIVQHVRSDKNRAVEKDKYEKGMTSAFKTIYEGLVPSGVLVVVFAHKDPDAWETVVSSMIRSGFVVKSSWPIQTEMPNRTRALSTAALSSSVWLVCRKRPEDARSGWDNQVLEEMRSKIYERLNEYWDAGIRGPDFVWSATGPALESYSKHPIVRKANQPNAVLTVSEFLREVRRIVVDYVVGRVLSRDGDGEVASDLDDLTIYYLLHRNDFGFADAPTGAVILYAQSCGLSDRDLCDTHELLIRSGGRSAQEGEAASPDSAEEPQEGTGSAMRLRAWHHRRRQSLGLATEGHPTPLIDQVHRLMRLWKQGDVHRVDAYIEEMGLRRNELFHRLLQSLIELAGRDGQADERTLLESISNHLQVRGVAPEKTRRMFDVDAQ